ncbi:MAG: hypothetical protein H7061_11440 [Bdellovibrionaceae bacterium]|nr:hypothetical protein [Bdellovibrio sp.]
MNDILNDSAWKKTLELVKDKYGKSLSYRSMKILGENQDSTFYSQGDDLIVPLRLKNHNLGDVIVARGSLLDSQQKSEVVDLIKFLVEPKVYNLHLKQSEENSKLIDEPNNTVRMDRRPLTLQVFTNKITTRKTLSQIIHLKSIKPLTRQKVAAKIHEMTERNLFVHLDDISASLTSVQDIKTLADTTIFIESIEDLSPTMLQLLQKYLENSFEDGPLFLIGSGLALIDIQNQTWSTSLKNDLMGFYFDIDRVPPSQQTSEDILELLFFQLDGFTV